MSPPQVVTLDAVDEEARVLGGERQANVTWQIVGTFVATFVFEVSLDATTWVARSVSPTDGGPNVTSATAPGVWSTGLSGWTYFRVRCSAYTSGSATVHLSPALVW